jgi:hypothetical protein
MARKKAIVYSQPTSEEVVKFTQTVDTAIFRCIMRCFQNVSWHDLDTSLGNTGWSLRDCRQYLLTEAFVALSKFNPEYSASKKNTFVMCHIFNRANTLAKRLTLQDKGYGTQQCSLKSEHENLI